MSLTRISWSNYYTPQTLGKGGSPTYFNDFRTKIYYVGKYEVNDKLYVYNDPWELSRWNHDTDVKSVAYIHYLDISTPIPHTTIYDTYGDNNNGDIPSWIFIHFIWYR